MILSTTCTNPELGVARIVAYPTQDDLHGENEQDNAIDSFQKCLGATIYFHIRAQADHDARNDNDDGDEVLESRRLCPAAARVCYS